MTTLLTTGDLDFAGLILTVHQNGFGIVPKVFTSLDIDALITEMEQGQFVRSKAGIRHAMRLVRVQEIAMDQRLLRIAHAVLGNEALPYRATLFDKSASSNWLVVWHQDTALPMREKGNIAGWGPWSVKEGITYAHAPASALEQVLAIRVHLDDSTSDNGPLRALPGTHNRGVLSDDQIHSLAEQVRAHDCLVMKGGLVLMRPLLVHASSKSRSSAARRVLHIEYAATTVFENVLHFTSPIHG